MNYGDDSVWDGERGHNGGIEMGIGAMMTDDVMMNMMDMIPTCWISQIKSDEVTKAVHLVCS